MNGKVVQAHADIERHCNSCHQPWAGASADRCLVCHEPVVHDKNHAAVDQACGICHQEHRGRSQSLTSLDVVPCQTCHHDILSMGRHPQTTAQQCLFCHAQHAPRTFARRTSSNLIMPHQTHVQMPGLVQAPCEQCHRPAPQAARMQYPQESVCKSCHFGYTHDKTQDIRAKTCRTCHYPTNRIRITHKKGFDSLRFSHANHRAFSCQQCHAEVNMSMSLSEIQLPTVTTCKKCH